MIISCNSCEKKFVVPDKAITLEGRVVQCGSCGNKWRQFPFKKEIGEKIKKIDSEKTVKKSQINKKKPIRKKKKREIDLYSPEYLAKKHGIKLDADTNSLKSKNSTVGETSFGFYAYLLILIVFLIFFLKLIYFFQDKFIALFPFTEIYLDILFEIITNFFHFWRDLVSNY
tara:strand:+ start:114 stop:626 length:513 start_codon:yes stop_codon:yes gene_type:complete